MTGRVWEKDKRMVAEGWSGGESRRRELRGGEEQAKTVMEGKWEKQEG